MAQTVTVQILADNGTTRSTNFYFGDAATETEIQTSMNRHAADLDAAIDGQITSINLIKPLDLPAGMKATPEVNSNHDNAVRYIFTTANGYTTTKTITTVNEGSINYTVNPPVPGSANLQTFADNIVSNPDVGTTPTTDYRGDDITSEKSARAF